MTAKYTIKDTFKITGRALVLAGPIDEGTIYIGDYIEFMLWTRKKRDIMKTLTTSSIIFFLFFSFVTARGQTETPSALEVVNRRMDLYNQHNFSEFIKLYSPDVRIYTYPEKLLATGTDNIASIFKPKFIAKSIQVEIVNQMNNGNHVISHEIVTENGTKTKYISIYEVSDGLIRSVRFVRDYK